MGSAQTCITQQVQTPNAQGICKTYILIDIHDVYFWHHNIIIMPQCRYGAYGVRPNQHNREDGDAKYTK
jgi:hypothetical protein